MNKNLNIVVVGASGDLAKRKIFPALFSLFSQGLLPENTHFFGFARSDLSHEEFRERISMNLTCRYTPEPHDCQQYISDFLGRCYYNRGNYNSGDSFLDLYSLMREYGEADKTDRIFFLAIPPSIFVDVSRAIGDAGLVQCDNPDYWSRVVIEKPFGRDRESSDLLGRELAEVFVEDQTYRIDHYLGKDMVQNLLVLRFANQLFKPIWNSEFIERVDISWQEDLGIEGRGGYFDDYGIIRDVVQNHLLQIVALLSMEEPRSLKAENVRDQKVAALRLIPQVKMEDLVIGQFTAGNYRGKEVPGYCDDSTVSADSLTPTFAKVALTVENDRWRGVPFTIFAGKGLSERKTEIRIVFRKSEASIFCGVNGCPPANELVIKVQPDERIFLRIINKEPGLDMKFNSKELDLSYQNVYSDRVIPEAYESLLLDVVKGEKGLFIRKDELAAAWDIFTPVLKQIEKEKIVPDSYPFGSNGPERAQEATEESCCRRNK